MLIFYGKKIKKTISSNPFTTVNLNIGVNQQSTLYFKHKILNKLIFIDKVFVEKFINSSNFISLLCMYI